MASKWDLAIAERPAGDGPGEDRWLFWESSEGIAWAAVIDGASSDVGLRPDGGDYADAFCSALTRAVKDDPTISTVEALHRGIVDTVAALQLPQPSEPSAAVGLVRWHPSSGVTGAALGDVSIAILGRENDQVLRDTRLASIDPRDRALYKEALAAGGGYGTGHRRTMERIRSAERALRNSEAGYWIAADDPKAAGQALTLRVAEGADAVVIASDGAAAAINRYRLVPSWREFALRLREDAGDLTRRIHATEVSDPHGEKWPRSKAQDDLVALVISARGVADSAVRHRQPGRWVDGT